MVSNFPDGKRVFLDNDGLSILLRALQGNILKVKTKASSMLRSIISESLMPELEDTAVRGTFYVIIKQSFYK